MQIDEALHTLFTPKLPITAVNTALLPTKRSTLRPVLSGRKLMAAKPHPHPHPEEEDFTTRWHVVNGMM